MLVILTSLLYSLLGTLIISNLNGIFLLKVFMRSNDIVPNHQEVRIHRKAH